MKFSDLVTQASALLKAKGRVSARMLKREFALDEETLQDLKFELVHTDRVAKEEEGERMEVDHILPRGCGGTDGKDNLQLLHRHCHDRKTASDSHRPGTSDKRHVTEEPCEGPTLMHGFGAEPGW